jgi:DNA-binding PadR family transcriptional regulator
VGVRIDKDLVAASATPLVLGILSEGESYGYAIGKRVRDLSSGRLAWTDGMLYPLLHRLERLGYVSSAWHTSEQGRKRKHYAITRSGSAALTEQRAQWRAVEETFERLWRGPLLAGDPA